MQRKDNDLNDWNNQRTTVSNENWDKQDVVVVVVVTFILRRLCDVVVVDFL